MLQKCSICLQKSASIQPRTSLRKFGTFFKATFFKGKQEGSNGRNWVPQGEWRAFHLRERKWGPGTLGRVTTSHSLLARESVRHRVLSPLRAYCRHCFRAQISVRPKGVGSSNGSLLPGFEVKLGSKVWSSGQYL